MKDWLCETCLHREQDEDVCGSCEPEDPVRSCYTSVRASFGTQYKDTRVQCPFYKWAKIKHRLLYCEGPVEDASVTLFFKRKKMLEDYLHERCEGDYKDCPVHQMANQKYETEG